MLVLALAFRLAGGKHHLEYGIHTLRADGETLNLVKEAGADWLVQLFSWREIARWRDQYHWEYPDAVVRGAEFYGLKLAVRLDQHPAWARSRPAQNGPPDNLNDYGDFVQAVATRYRGRISAYIIWNEPNLAREWGDSTPDPIAYVEMLKVAYHRAKAADPECIIVSAGLAPTNHNDEQAMDDRLFLKAMYEAGAKEYFDVLGAHPYGFAYSPEEQPGAHKGLNFARLLDLRDIMQTYGDGDKPIWATEMGWTVGDSWQKVTLEKQAEYLAGAFRRAEREWPWLKMMAVWNLGRNLPPEDEKQGYNLLDEEGRPRPAYQAFKALPKGRAFPRSLLADWWKNLSLAIKLWNKKQRAEVLAQDVILHLGDSELPPPWMPLRQGLNPALEWEGEFYVESLRGRDWVLYAELMQPNERGSYFSVNGYRLEPDLPVEDYSRTWVAFSWEVPSSYLRPGLNRLRLVLGRELPDYQQLGYTWDDLQLRNVFLQEQ